MMIVGLTAIPSTAQQAAFGPDTYTIASSAPPTATGLSGGSNLIITPSFTSNFVADFGANAAAAEAAWIAAANVYATNFSNPVHINITVDAVTGTGVFGESNTSLFSTSYANLRSLLVSHASANNVALNTALGAGGSMTSADPTGGAGTWWVSSGEAKAIGLISDSLTNNDGTTTFGAGNPFTFSGAIASGTYDFKGVAEHEISEVMGRLGLKGGSIGGHSPSYELIDDYSFTGPATRLLAGGANDYFSLDDGTTLLKEYNNYLSNSLDSRDWAPGTFDADNQFSNSGVMNPVSAVDLQEMNAMGYNPVPAPEPSTVTLLGIVGVAWLEYASRKRRLKKPSLQMVEELAC